MHSIRQYNKLTKKGQIKKVTIEHYLRDDIWSGSPLDSSCDPSQHRLSSAATHYVVIDTNIALHQLTFLEDPNVTDVIICSTVLNEVRGRNNSAYERLRRLVSSPTKRFYAFANEHHRETYIGPAEQNESPNDRNDRALRRAAEWYREKVTQIPVVLLTDDAGNRRAAAALGIESVSAVEYCRTYKKDTPALLDLVAGDSGTAVQDTDLADGKRRLAAGSSSSPPSSAANKALFPPHLSDAALAEGLRSGRLHRGTLRVSEFRRSEGLVGCEGVGSDVLISGERSMNRGVDGDVVVIEVLPDAEWRKPSARLPGGGRGKGGVKEGGKGEGKQEEKKKKKRKTKKNGKQQEEEGEGKGEEVEEEEEEEEGDDDDDDEMDQDDENSNVKGAGGDGGNDNDKDPDSLENDEQVAVFRVGCEDALDGETTALDAGIEAAAAVAAATSDGRMPTGKVVGILKRFWANRRICGSLVMQSDGKTPKGIRVGGGGRLRVLFEPVDRKLPPVRLLTSQAAALAGQRLLIRVDGWSETSRWPEGHLERAIGPVGDRATETEVILIEHDVAHADFSPAVHQCVPPLPWVVSPTDLTQRGRVDLRHLPVCSVDPPGCKDIDDALHVRQLPNGHWEVGVHIADVTHFLKPDTAMDAEAMSRATSTYLVQRRIDMLPKPLTEDICSLRGGVERLTFSVLWEVNDEAQILGTTFTKAVIKSRAALSYQQAQEMIDDPTKTDELTESLRVMNRLAKIMRKRRAELGALQLASPEVKFELEAPVPILDKDGNVVVAAAAEEEEKKKSGRTDAEEEEGKEHRSEVETTNNNNNNNNNASEAGAKPATPQLSDEEERNRLEVKKVGVYQVRETNQMVEEMMLLANVAVAEEIARRFPACALLRRHQTPPERQFAPLLRAATAAGIHIDVSTSKTLAASLDDAVRESDPYFNKLIRIMTTRCMTQARYFNSASCDPADYHHYGLASPIYTHFTSPIRRYADVVVHRLLAAAIGLDPIPDSARSRDALDACADNLNLRHRNAQLAGRASVELYTLDYFKAKPTTAEARVVKVKTNGLIVFIPKYGIEGVVYLDSAAKELIKAAERKKEEEEEEKEREERGGDRDKKESRNGKRKEAIETQQSNGIVWILDEEAQSVTSADGKIKFSIFDICAVHIEVIVQAGFRRSVKLQLKPLESVPVEERVTSV